MIGRLLYFVRRALGNMQGERTATFLTLMVVTICFLIFGSYVTLAINAAGFMQDFAGHVQIVFYLRGDADPQIAAEVARSMATEPEVLEAKFVSKEEAAERFRRDLVDLPEYRDLIEDVPVPASIEVRLRQGYRERPDAAPFLARYRDREIVEAVEAGDEFTRAFARVLAGIWLGGAVVAVFLMLSAVFIVANTIRLTILRRRDEIENMRLVGATSRFVNAPFVLEGVFVGALGAALAAGALYLLYTKVLVPVVVTGPVISVLTGFSPRFLTARMVAGGMALGAFVGLLGAQLSVGRYLKP